MTLAEKFYRGFLQVYASDPSIRAAYRRNPSPKQWTKAMLTMLRRWGKDSGYEVGGQTLRVDMLWKKNSKIHVAIDHENHGDDIDRLLRTEVRNLSSINCTLAVLITYFETKHFDEILRQLVEKTLFEIRKRPPSDFEFLVLVSPWKFGATPEDQFWVGYRYFPSFDVTPMLYPPDTYSH